MSPIRVLHRRSLPTSSSLYSQWTNPSDILSLLLLIGGDVIRCALAQQVGDRFPTPVVFSFGWVAYAFLTVLSSVGNGQLMPDSPDCSAVVFSTQFGYPRTNQSWILGRLLRDFESYWMPAQAKKGLTEMLRQAGSQKAGLCISVFEAAHSPAVAGVPKRDIYWYSGYAVAIVQLAIASIPWGVWGEWEIFIITAGGTLLAFATGSLDRWRTERWHCRRNSKKNFVLTRGNGSQHALVVLGQGRGLDLEDLATSGEAVGSLGTTRIAILGLAVLWVALLLTVSGIKNHTWFLVAVGALGMVHTIVIAGAPRKPEWFGVPLEYCNVFANRKVIDALKAAETEYPGVGRAMLPTFFPAGLKPDEDEWWNIMLEPERRKNFESQTTLGSEGQDDRHSATIITDGHAYQRSPTVTSEAPPVDTGSP